MLGLLLAVEVAGLLATTGTGIILPVSGAQSVGLSISPTLLGVVRVQTSLDGGVTFWDEPAAGPVYLGTSSTQYSGSFPLPPGATHAQLIVRDWTSGSSPARLWTSQATGPARATVTGTISGAGEFLTVAVNPTAWGFVHLSASGTPNSFNVQYSIDGGTNWLASTYLTRSDAVSATNLFLIGPFGTGIYPETDAPLPGDATHYRILYSSGSGGTLRLTTSRPYVPGTVVATLYDATSAVNTAISTQFSTSGWNTLLFGYSSASSSGWAYNSWVIDDAGAVNAKLVSLAAASAYGSIGNGTSLNVSSGGVPVAGTSQIVQPKRLLLTSDAIVGGTTRIRIEARR
jgi:hypothetical protein